MNRTDQQASGVDRHRFDYYRRPDMPLRPRPARIVPAPEWDRVRERTSATAAVPRLPEGERAQLIALLDDHFWQGDELMDAVVAAGKRLGAPSIRRMFDIALDEGIEKVDDAPGELVALFEQLDTKPSWFDAETFEFGRRVLNDATVFGKISGILGESLATSWGVAVSSATGSTGRIVRDAIRRQMESTEYFWAMSAPGAADRFAEPFKTNVRVRLMHAQVRAGLKARWGAEEFARHGNPISATDMASGASAFGLSSLFFEMSQGASYTEEELDAAAMCWAYIGYVFGIAEEVLPTTAARGAEILDYVISGHGAGSQWSDDLSEAIVDYMRMSILDAFSRGPLRLLQRPALLMLGGAVHYLVGDPLSGRFLASTSLTPRQLRVAAVLVGALGRTEIRVHNLRRWARSSAATTAVHSPNGDPFLARSNAGVRKLAERRGAQSRATFDSHDTSRPKDFDRALTRR